MKRTNVLAWVLVGSVAMIVAAGAAPPDPNKPSTSKPLPAPSPVAAIALPDILMKIESDGSIKIMNIGDVSVPKPFGVDITCTVKTATQPGQKCGDPFDASGRWFKLATLPPGTNVFPLKKTPGLTFKEDYGPGWAMFYPGVLSWAKGVYNLSGCANNDPPDPAKRVREKTKNNNCSYADVTRN
ncbi:MAG TPA: hypothetical protein VMT19_05100 [Thermoanaerobaculaceae bacterium]|nr:hypothetical protein [Thermoanaerobaculaceae bacterium]